LLANAAESATETIRRERLVIRVLAPLALPLAS